MSEIRVEKHGFVRLVDTMPREDLDHAIVQPPECRMEKAPRVFGVIEV
jgi:hypothetical protein